MSVRMIRKAQIDTSDGALLADTTPTATATRPVDRG